MDRYVVTLTAPSLGLMNMPDNYIKAYGVKADTLDILSSYVDDILMRDFALEFNVALDKVRVLFAAKVKK